MNKKSFITLISSLFLSLGFLLFPVEGRSDTDLHIGIGIGVPPPAVVIPASPSVYPIPGSYVYFAPDVGFELFFQSGYWYRPYNGYWYRAAFYNGPWYYLPPSRVPVVFAHLPHNYYRIPPGQRLIPYGHLKKHWGEWEKGYYKEEMGWRKTRHNQGRRQYEGWRAWREVNPHRANYRR